MPERMALVLWQDENQLMHRCDRMCWESMLEEQKVSQDETFCSSKREIPAGCFFNSAFYSWS